MNFTRQRGPQSLPRSVALLSCARALIPRLASNSSKASTSPRLIQVNLDVAVYVSVTVYDALEQSQMLLDRTA